MFSETVDAVIERSGKPQRLGDIVKYVNATIREQNSKRFYFRDLYEDELTADAEPYVWTFPRLLRKLKTIKYPGAEIEYPPRATPGKIQQGQDYYYYMASDYAVFKGVGDGGTVNVAYYQYQRPLKYYKKLDDTRPFITAYESVMGDLEVRPAVFDAADGADGSWTYYNGSAYVSTLGTDALDEAARLKVTNWLLNTWQGVIEEGGLAKILKSFDDQRAPSSFALYSTMAKQIETNELYESLDN